MEPAPYTSRVDPARHRGEDIGILAIVFLLDRHRSDRDHRGPRPLPPPRYAREDGDR